MDEFEKILCEKLGITRIGTRFKDAPEPEWSMESFYYGYETNLSAKWPNSVRKHILVNTQDFRSHRDSGNIMKNALRQWYRDHV